MKKVLVLCFLLLCFASSKSTNVYVGTYLNDITSFDLKEGRFKADLKLWCKWVGDSIIPPIQFTNGELDSKEIIRFERDGEWNSVQWRIQGTFRGTFPLHNFPFDNQDLQIKIDLPLTEGNLLPDLAGSGMENQFSITGWQYEPYFKAETKKSAYYSDFGSIAFEGKPFEMSTVVFFVNMKRPPTGLIIKYITPLLIIICVAISALFLPAENVDIRGDLSVNALLACVAFQFALSGSIPDVSYMVLADKFFIVSYVIILTVILLVNVTFNLSLKDDKKANKVDRIAYMALPIFLLIFAIHQIVTGVQKEEQKEVIAYNGPTLQSSKDTINFGVFRLSNLNRMGIQSGLIKRGLYYNVKGGKKEHLIERIPSMTNKYVRLLPNGGLIVTWKLKPNLKWGDGTAITSEDLAFSLDLNPDDNRERVEIIDELTIDVHYKNRMNNVLNAFRFLPEHHFSPVFESGGIDSIDKELYVKPYPLDGPYILDTFFLDSLVRFKRNPHFPGSQPAIKYVQIKKIRKGQKSPDLLRDGDLDISSYLSMNTYNIVKSYDHMQTRVESSPRLIYLHPDLNVPMLNDINVRKAIAHAINRDSIHSYMDGYMGGLAHSYRSYLSEDQIDTVVFYDYNPDKARTYLRAANVSVNQPIKLFAYFRDGDFPETKSVNQIAKDLRRIGLNVQLEKVRSTLKLIKPGNHGGLVFTTTSYTKGDFGKFWNIPQDKATKTYRLDTAQMLVDEWLVQKVDDYKRTFFLERKTAISKQVQEKYMKLLPTIPLIYLSEKSVYPRNFVGWDHMATDNRWWNAENWYFLPDTNARVDVNMKKEVEPSETKIEEPGFFSRLWSWFD
ncbi:MAG: ABC transporter substrate-binding protein [Flavobacteriales bacterium]|nr:ABC transporter substrate-binding protein [Flavobacteriales bacterium]